MTKRLFKTLSYILHPVFMPFIGAIIILTVSHLVLLPNESKKAILYLMGIITIFLPLAIVPVLYYLKIITGATISDRHERLVPMFLTTVFYYFCYIVLHKYSAPLFLQQYMLAVFISVLLASVINIKWKISLHMIGIGGLIGLLSVLAHMFGLNVNIILMAVILLAGVIGTGRLYLNEHSPAQIYGGFLLGYITNFGIIVLLYG